MLQIMSSTSGQQAKDSTAMTLQPPFQDNRWLPPAVSGPIRLLDSALVRYIIFHPPRAAASVSQAAQSAHAADGIAGRTGRGNGCTRAAAEARPVSPWRGLTGAARSQSVNL